MSPANLMFLNLSSIKLLIEVLNRIIEVRSLQKDTAFQYDTKPLLSLLGDSDPTTSGYTQQCCYPAHIVVGFFPQRDHEAHCQRACLIYILL